MFWVLKPRLVNEEFQVLLANVREQAITEVFRSSWTGDYNDAHTFLTILESGNPSNTPGYDKRGIWRADGQGGAAKGSTAAQDLP